MSPDPTTATPAANATLLSIYNVIVEPILFLLVGLATVVFLWGIVEFIAGAGNEEKRRAGQKHMLWGVIGIFVMLSVFGIARIIANTLGVDIPIELQ